MAMLDDAPPQHAPYRIADIATTFMSRSEEMRLIEQAHARDPGNRALTERLAQACFAHDQFDRAIMLLEGFCAEGEPAEALHIWGLCLLARENEADTLKAIDVLRRSVAAAPEPHVASYALSAIGKGLMRLDRMAEARVALTDAIAHYANNKDAFKRLTMADFLDEREEDALALAEGLMASGTLHARTFAVQAMALARMGKTAEARTAFGLDQFLSAAPLQAPDGWADIAALNRDVAAELVNHPGYHFERYGAASQQSWRVDDPALARCKAITALLRAIKAAAEDYVNRLPATDHLWPRAQRSGGHIHPWAVISYGSGYEQWHVHQNGWLSGAYYVEVPDAIRTGSDDAGCIGFGLPENLVGDAAHQAFGMHMIRPEPGLLTLFPSHSFHRTFPYAGGERRICLAFDIAPPPAYLADRRAARPDRQPVAA